MVPDWKLERLAMAQGYTAVCGCDEAGAGPLAGPVCAGAVILPAGVAIPGLNDSKQIPEKKREQLYEAITSLAVSWAAAMVSPEEIDRTDILSARIQAMEQAIRALSPPADFALIDGNRDKGRSCRLTIAHELAVKGDARSVSIAAASIIAKVTRDRYMVRMDGKYPGYGFAKHKGYGTAEHYAALDKYGVCAIHRRSFLKKWELHRREGANKEASNHYENTNGQ